MRKIDEGHKYEVENVDAGSQELQFIKKAPTSPTDETLETVTDGTTNEEVLAVLIDRIKYLNQKFPSRQNSIVITKLEEALMWLENRTAERKLRGVEGKHLA